MIVNPRGKTSRADVRRRGKLELELRTDAPSLMAGLVAALKARGFTRMRLTTITADQARAAVIGLVPGPLASNEIDAAVVLMELDAFARTQAIDLGRYPVQRLATESASPVITMPLHACAKWLRPSYAGSYEDRFVVRVESDDRAASQRIVDTLRKDGFRAIRRAIRSEHLGFSISSPKGPDAIAFIEPIRRVMEAAIKESAGGEEAEYGISLFETKTDEVTAVLPVAALASGALMETMSAPELYACSLFAANPDSPAVAGVKRRLSALGWRSLSVKRTDTTHGPKITYGGAPSPLVRRVRDLLEEVLPGCKPRLEQRWARHDHDVWIHLPPELAPVVVPTRVAAPTGLAAEIPSVDRPFVEVHDDHVAIGRHVLPRRPRHALAPDPADFARYVIDQPTAENLSHIATSLVAAEPCLIEGPTATSKTSAMLFLASVLGQGAIRLNLNGQTDTTELIGRYQPGGGTWRWLQGAVPRAMREGLWLLLDEINLCEPNVIERLNSVLELSPSLYLGEFDGSVIGGSGGEPTHRDFRVLASLNPLEGHVGRSPLSPALRDRFIGYRVARRADADDVAGKLRFLLRGEEPSVVIDGTRYPRRASSTRAYYAGLAQVLPELDPVVTAIARFHVGAETACEAQDGAGDRPLVTRRSLLACLAYLDAHRATTPQAWAASLWRGLERYYLDRATDPALRASLVALATATGIGPNRWSFS